MGNSVTKNPNFITPAQGIGVMTYVCLIVFASVILILLQWQYWHGENGHANLAVLNEQIAKQSEKNIKQAYVNNLLRADINDLKMHPSAIEEHARLDLGLIKSGETFFQLSNAPLAYDYSQTTADEADAIEPIDDGVVPDDQAVQ